jgi:hypothetical protein
MAPKTTRPWCKRSSSRNNLISFANSVAEQLGRVMPEDGGPPPLRTAASKFPAAQNHGAVSINITAVSLRLAAHDLDHFD